MLRRVAGRLSFLTGWPSRDVRSRPGSPPQGEGRLDPTATPNSSVALVKLIPTSASVCESSAVRKHEVRDDLAEVQKRQSRKGDDASLRGGRAGRHAGGARTARENVADLVDEGTFAEVRRPRDGRTAHAPRNRGADQPHPGRRARRRHRPRQRRAVRGSRAPAPCSPTTTPSSTAPKAPTGHRKKDRLFELLDGAYAAAYRLLRRGRRRAARRQRLRRRLRPRHPRLRALGPALRRGAEDRGRLRPLLTPAATP